MSIQVFEIIKKEIETLIPRYPKKEAVLLPALHVVQKKLGFIPPEAEKLVAQILGIKPVRVREVVSFYTMFTTKPLGKYHLQVCSNLSCSLAGGSKILSYIKEKLQINPGETTPDGHFTLSTVECLGACDHGPCMMVNDDLYGHLNENKIDELLVKLD
ncbi:MAG: NADH-quinone oxidoreductase subunit NuoE [Candidatus Aminicenantes bacterium]|nr:NADH-quinone oxidoreductase subunit NuoE [Candidatus Aminicenantes bacterium]